jgi:response regulator RpfG family c-di-GMP phosphodiesterase
MKRNERQEVALTHPRPVDLLRMPSGRCPELAPHRSPMTVVLVSDQPFTALASGLLADAGDYDVIAVESLAHAYSRIKRLTPDLVVAFFSIEDVAACQLLTMLTMDETLAHVPVMTCAMRPDADAVEEMLTEEDFESPAQVFPTPLN